MILLVSFFYYKQQYEGRNSRAACEGIATIFNTNKAGQSSSGTKDRLIVAVSFMA